jgi:hypothetical protein
MKYNSRFENFIDGIDFSKDDACVWIVYPMGAAGDLLAAIVNFHYGRTACHYFGINDYGQVIFRPTDSKLTNIKYTQHQHIELNQQIIHDINNEIGKKHLNYSLMDQVIFSNHTWHNKQVTEILDFFPKAKIIRVTPGNLLEQQVIYWLARYKNKNRYGDFVYDQTAMFEPAPQFAHSRLIDISFGDLINVEKFETVYSNIIKHLDLKYKLIRFDLIEHWINSQHAVIQPVLHTIKSR